MAHLRLGILISGRGSNLQALIDACSQADFPADIALVISNEPEVYGLARAEKAGLTAATISHRGRSRESFEAEIEQALHTAQVDLICLAGFMRILTPAFVERWLGRIINIHPSLLPAFKGLHVHEQAISAGVRISGCTVHYVVPQMDSGPIIIQAAVPVLPNDNPSKLAERILIAEHQIYPQAVRWIAEGRVELKNGQAITAASPLPSQPLISPTFQL